MKSKIMLIIIFIAGYAVASCTSTVKQEELQGTWIYKKVEFLKQNPVVIQEEKDLQNKNPYIEIKQDGSLKIYSAGKVISKGEYFLEGSIIRYEEVLEGGIKRKIPFLIKTLKENILVFETMDKDLTRITAAKK